MVRYAEPHVIALAKKLLEGDGVPSVVAIKVDLSTRTIERCRLCFDLFGTAYAPSGIVAVGQCR